MRNILRQIAREMVLFCLSACGVYKICRYQNRDRVLIMVYHDIVNDDFQYDSEHYNYNTTIGIRNFEKQIKYLSKHYTPITLEDFTDWKINGKHLPENSLLVTFDDGHSNLYNNAIPILNKYNIKAVFFVKSALFGNIKQNYCEKYLSCFKSHKDGQEGYNIFRNACFEEQLNFIRKYKRRIKYDFVSEEKYGHMTIEQCRKLINDGHSVQSHSVNHFIMSALSDDMADAEIRESKIQLEKLFNETITSYAYPFGDPKYDYSDRERELLRKYGYLFGFSGEWQNPKGVSKSDDNYSISRFGDVNHDLLYFKLLLSPIRLM